VAEGLYSCALDPDSLFFDHPRIAANDMDGATPLSLMISQANSFQWTSLSKVPVIAVRNSPSIAKITPNSVLEDDCPKLIQIEGLHFSQDLQFVVADEGASLSDCKLVSETLATCNLDSCGYSPASTGEININVILDVVPL